MKIGGSWYFFFQNIGSLVIPFWMASETAEGVRCYSVSWSLGSDENTWLILIFFGQIIKANLGQHVSGISPCLLHFLCVRSTNYIVFQWIVQTNNYKRRMNRTKPTLIIPPACPLTKCEHHLYSNIYYYIRT